MKYDYTIEYNGVTASSVGIDVVKRPNIPCASVRREPITVPGRDGTLYRTDKEVEDIEIEIQLNFMEDSDSWMERHRKARKWLSSGGNKVLRVSDDTDYLYRVKYVEMTNNERTDWQIGRFTAVFMCEGYQYLAEGEREYTAEKCKYNPYMTSKPVYKIAGEGMCYLTVNGKTMSANVGQSLIINTELMIAYRENGDIMNTTVTGNYEDLYLTEGENEISITTGFALTVIPHWRVI